MRKVSLLEIVGGSLITLFSAAPLKAVFLVTAKCFLFFFLLDLLPVDEATRFALDGMYELLEGDK